MATEEELRAEEYVRQAARRRAFQVQLDAKLHGQPGVRNALRIAWEPYVQWLSERDVVEPNDERF